MSTRILHVTRHSGLSSEIAGIFRRFPCVYLETFDFNDGVNLDSESSGLNYNVNRRRAELVWETYRIFFQTFDMVLVSDTTPMARPFLEGDRWRKPIILYVCNRFDFSNQDIDFPLAQEEMVSSYFPDEDFYQLMREVTHRPNVRLVASNLFESWYAQHWRGIDWSHAEVIYPPGVGNQRPWKEEGEESELSADGTAFLLPPGVYALHNEEELEVNVKDIVLVPDRGVVGGT